MAAEIKLNGGEITVLKAMGLSGSSILGKMLIERAGEMEPAEFLDTLVGLLDLGYVVSNRVNVRNLAEVEIALFRVSPTHARDLKEAVVPAGSRTKVRERRRRRN